MDDFLDLLDQDLERGRQKLITCNQTELLTLAAGLGIRTHQGVEREALIHSILTGEPLPPNPLDHDRDRLMHLLEKYHSSLRTQLECPQDCYAHGDGYVVNCTIKAQRVLERERNS